MTAKSYVVAYPNLSISPRMRTCQIEVDSLTDRTDIFCQLYLEFPDHTEDLGHTILYKISHCLSTAHACVQSLSQAINLKLDDVETQSMQGVRNWFRDKRKTLSFPMPAVS